MDDNSMLPTEARGVWINGHGGPEVLRIEAHPLQALGPNDIMVKVAASSVSGWDLKYRRGISEKLENPGRGKFPVPQQLGREAAGTVIAVGNDVRSHRVGDRVVAVVHPESTTSPEGNRDLGNLAHDVVMPGHQGLGNNAEYLVRDEHMWLPVPDNVSLEQAAVTLWPFDTAHRVVQDRLRLRLGESVLIHGATGGMGNAAAQLALLAGARVIATTRSAEKREKLAEIGVDVVVVGEQTASTAAEIRALTGGEGVDSVIDFTDNRRLIELSIAALRLGGRMCLAGGDPSELPLSTADLVRLECTVMGVRGARRRDALAVLDLLHRGLINTPIAARFPLSQAAEAHRMLENDQSMVGRIVLIP